VETLHTDNLYLVARVKQHEETEKAYSTTVRWKQQSGCAPAVLYVRYIDTSTDALG